MGPKVDVCPPGDQNEAFWPINNELEAIRALIFPSEVDRCSFQGGLKTLKELDGKGLRSTVVRHSEFLLIPKWISALRGIIMKHFGQLTMSWKHYGL